MSQGYVAFLNSGGGVRGHCENQIRDIRQLPAPAGHADGCQADITGGIDGLDDIGGFSAGTDTPGKAILSAGSCHLLGKDILLAIIVADAGR